MIIFRTSQTKITKEICSKLSDFPYEYTSRKQSLYFATDGKKIGAITTDANHLTYILPIISNEG